MVVLVTFKTDIAKIKEKIKKKSSLNRVFIVDGHEEADKLKNKINQSGFSMDGVVIIIDDIPKY